MILPRIRPLESSADAREQSIRSKWLDQIANDAVSQDPSPDALIEIGGNQDRRNGLPRLHEVTMQLNSRHMRHLDVCDQTRGVLDAGGFQESHRRGEGLDLVPQRLNETGYRLADNIIVINDRN